MSFYGTSMIFDGIACEEMGLIMYDFDSHKQEETSFTSNLSILEDRIEGRYRSLFYGGSVNEPLTFTMVLCASEDRAYRNEPFDRWDLQKIASWLTGHTTYKWLSIVQPDMEQIRYRCIITDLKAVEVAGTKWGLSCKVTCDSPFAYLAPRTYSYAIEDSGEFELFSESTYNGCYRPTIDITGHGGGDISIVVQSVHGSSEFKFVGLPASIGDIHIDCENGVIVTSSGLNAYEYVSFTSGFSFPGFYRGVNHLTISGTGQYDFTCEWPVNVGG